ncbi:MAG: rhodanese-like domain-containing protein [Chloroflexota bacterium]
MGRESWIRAAGLMGVALLLFTLALSLACGGNGGEPQPTPTSPAQVSEFEVVQDAVDDYLADKAAGKNGGNIAAVDLYALLNDGDPGNDPYIVSCRSAADYANGHIPGAVNLGSFSELSSLPKDEDILVYCYTGQSASAATAVLGTMGYDVQNLLHGMSSWTTESAVYVSRFDAATHQNDYAVETSANTASGGNEYPEIENTTSTDEDAIIEAAATTVSPQYIDASDLYALLNDGDPDTDPFIIDCRSADDYAAGHVPGAVNIGIGSLADSLDKLPADETIVVYCYTGHTANHAAAVLNMLGYDAKSLKFGFCSWSSTATKCFDAATAAHDYDVES